MPLSVAVFELLKEKLGDTKYPEQVDGKDVTLLDVVAGKNGWFEQTEHAASTKSNNADLVKQRDAWLAEKANLEKTKVSLEADLEAVRKEIKDKNGKASEQDIAERNALKKAVEDTQAALKKMTDELAAEKAKQSQTAEQLEKTALEKDLTSLLGGKKIVKYAKVALNTLLTDGNVKLVKKEDGSGYERQFRLFNNGQPLAATPDGVVEWFAKENPALVEAGDPRGSGAPPGSSGGGSGNRPSATQMLTMK